MAEAPRPGATVNPIPADFFPPVTRQPTMRELLQPSYSSNGTYGRAHTLSQGPLPRRSPPAQPAPPPEYGIRNVKSVQQFDDGSVLATRHDGTTFARPGSQQLENLRAQGWQIRELENGESRAIGPSNVRFRGRVNRDGTFVVSRGGVSAPEDQSGAGGGRSTRVPNWKSGWDGFGRASATMGGGRFDPSGL